MDLSPVEAIEKVLGAGMDADFEELWDCIKSSVNARTEQDQWTALMVACGSPVDTTEFIQKMVAAGADVTAVDGDGWTALHWSAFHGCPDSAAVLLEVSPDHKVAELLEIKALDGRLATEVAKAEGHVSVEAVITKFASLLASASLATWSSGPIESPVSAEEEDDDAEQQPVVDDEDEQA